MVGMFWVIFGWVLSVVIAFILGAVYAHRGEPLDSGDRATGCHRVSGTPRRR